jgi:hypothetical protein
MKTLKTAIEITLSFMMVVIGGLFMGLPIFLVFLFDFPVGYLLLFPVNTFIMAYISVLYDNYADNKRNKNEKHKK